MQTRIHLLRYIREKPDWRFFDIGRLTDGTEHNAGERIAQDELKDTGDEQQKTTKEYNGTAL